MLSANLPNLLSLAVAFVTGGYGLGTWLGKTLATLLDRDRAHWSDVGGVYGGIVGLGLYLGVVAAILWS